MLIFGTDMPGAGTQEGVSIVHGQPFFPGGGGGSEESEGIVGMDI